MKPKSKQSLAKRFGVGLPLAPVWGLTALLLMPTPGCRTPPMGDHASSPRVYSIGRQATLSFDPTQELTIPVEGRNLYDSASQRVAVTIVGSCPIGTNEYGFDKSAQRAGADVLNIIIKTNYLGRVRTSDTLDVAVHMHSLTGLEGAIAELGRSFDKWAGPTNTSAEEVQAGLEAIHYLRFYLRSYASRKGPGWTELSNAIAPLFAAETNYHRKKEALLATNQEPASQEASCTWRLYEAIRLQLPEIVAALRIYSERSSPSEQAAKERAVYTASRCFTLYESEQYRSHYQSKRLTPDNILAFPLPTEDAIKLFGKRISDNYFVVRLSVRNTEADDRLISTGMIRARGRAIVQKDPKFINTIFTVPVEVSPHSLQQVYAVLTDTAADTKRAVFFRSLEFGGALASGYMLGFNSSETAKDALQLATGVGIPGLRELWTDKEPGFRRNLVNFGMEDLVKVPKGSVTSHRFLFFPKKALEGLVIDQLSYRWEQSFSLKPWNSSFWQYPSLNGSEELSLPKGSFKPPVAQIAYLVVDNMEIPFEQVFPAEPADIHIRVLALRTDMVEYLKRLDWISGSWTNGNTNAVFGQRLAMTQLEAGTNGLASQLARLRSELSSLAATNEPGKALSTVEALLGAFNPPTLTNSLLFNDLRLLQSDVLQLEQIQQALLSGQPASRFEALLADMSATIEKNRTALAFYDTAAALLADKHTLEGLAAAKNSATIPAGLKEQLARLGQLRGSGLRQTLFPANEFFDNPPSQPAR